MISLDFPEIKKLLSKELLNILSYWVKHVVDAKGGFYGQVDYFGKANEKSEKGIILNSRILWTFAAAYNFKGEKEYKNLAHRAYNYLLDFFIDTSYGGVFWSISSKGKPIDKKKQIYAQAFMIYALSEYYKFEKNSEVLNLAVLIYELLEKHSYDSKNKGYIEAFNEQWEELKDVRLSEKDDNQKKSMNTHLHVLEAYTNLYRVYKNDQLKEKLQELIEVFFKYIINNQTYHLNLFFDEQWNVKSNKISYGHDIEASWLLSEAAEVLNDKQLMKKTNNYSLKIAEAAQEGFDLDGGMMNEFDLSTHHLDSDKHWWPQAETMVGFLNAYQLSGNDKYLSHFYKSLIFTLNNVVDYINGEWHWRVSKEGKPFKDEKVGFWKCPYHNSRACMESLKRLDQIYKN